MEPPRSHRAMIFKGWMFHSYVYHGYRLLISQIYIYIYDSYWFIMCFTSPFTCPITAIPMSEKKRMLSNSTSWKSSPSPTNLHAQDVAAVAILATFQLLRVFHAPAQMLMALGFALAFVGFWVLCLGLVDVKERAALVYRLPRCADRVAMTRATKQLTLRIFTNYHQHTEGF